MRRYVFNISNLINYSPCIEGVPYSLGRNFKIWVRFYEKISIYSSLSTFFRLKWSKWIEKSSKLIFDITSNLSLTFLWNSIKMKRSENLWHKSHICSKCANFTNSDRGEIWRDWMHYILRLIFKKYSWMLGVISVDLLMILLYLFHNKFKSRDPWSDRSHILQSMCYNSIASISLTG